MTPLLRILLSVADYGLTACPLPTSSHSRLADAFGHRTLPVGTGSATTKAELLDALAQDLELPDWFGHNLDAAHEALHDQLADNTDTIIMLETPAILASGDHGIALAFVQLVHDVHVERQRSGLLVGHPSVEVAERLRS